MPAGRSDAPPALHGRDFTIKTQDGNLVAEVAGQTFQIVDEDGNPISMDVGGVVGPSWTGAETVEGPLTGDVEIDDLVGLNLEVTTGALRVVQQLTQLQSLEGSLTDNVTINDLVGRNLGVSGGVLNLDTALGSITEIDGAITPSPIQNFAGTNLEVVGNVLRLVANLSSITSITGSVTGGTQITDLVGDQLDIEAGVLHVDGISRAIANGSVYADDGDVYSTIQAAEDAASSFIFIGPGTFQENVVVDTVDLRVTGAGRSTFVDGQGTEKAIEIAANGVTVEYLQAATDAASGFAAIGADATFNDVTVMRTFVSNAGDVGIDGDGERWFVGLNRIQDTDDAGVHMFGPGTGADVSDNQVMLNMIQNTGAEGILSEGNPAGIVALNTIEDTGNHGIRNTNNSPLAAILGNSIRLTAGSTDGIRLLGLGTLAFGNRIEDAGRHGIALDDAKVHALLNSIENPGTHGIANPSGNDKLIALNYIRIPGSNGLALQANNAIAAVANFIDNPGGSGIGANTTDAFIVLNYVFGAGTRGIFNFGADGIISLNMVKENGPSQAILGDGSRQNIGRNHVADAPVGIEAAATDQLISDNITNNTTTAIDTSNATTPTVTDNVTT